MTEAAESVSPPHYLGHREQLRDRFRKGGADALGEYELLELILFRATAIFAKMNIRHFKHLRRASG